MGATGRRGEEELVAGREWMGSGWEGGEEERRGREGMPVGVDTRASW